MGNVSQGKLGLLGVAEVTGDVSEDPGIRPANLLPDVGNLHRLELWGPWAASHLRFQDLCLSSGSIKHRLCESVKVSLLILVCEMEVNVQCLT